MAGGGGGKNKKKRNSKDSTGSNGGGGGEKKKNKKKSSSKGSKFSCDIFNEAAMENAYYLCHNVQDVLKSRGFPWPEAQKKKKKGKR